MLGFLQNQSRHTSGENRLLCAVDAHADPYILDSNVSCIDNS